MADDEAELAGVLSRLFFSLIGDPPPIPHSCSFSVLRSVTDKESSLGLGLDAKSAGRDDRSLSASAP